VEARPLPLLSRLAALLLAGAPVGALAVDGVVEINQARALAGGVTPGDGPGFPVSITQPGSYRLTGGLSGAEGQPVIWIAADDVTLDLGGFEIVGNGVDPGIFANASDDVTVRGGTVRDVGWAAIALAVRGLVENVTVRNAAGDGITCDSGCRLRDLVVSSSGSWSVACGSGCDVLRSDIASALGGILADSGSRVEGNRIAAAGSGISVGTSSIVERNSVEGATIAVTAGGTATIRDNVLTNSGQFAVFVNEFGLIEGNLIIGVSAGRGIVSGDGSLVRGNVVRGASDYGLSTPGTSGYASNVFSDNNGGDANGQVNGGNDLGGNVCGAPPACP
jgi:hypothetical protein